MSVNTSGPSGRELLFLKTFFYLHLALILGKKSSLNRKKWPIRTKTKKKVLPYTLYLCLLIAPRPSTVQCNVQHSRLPSTNHGSRKAWQNTSQYLWVTILWSRKLTLVLLATNSANEIMQNHEKYLGTHLKVLSESYPMRTSMAGFRCFSKFFASLCIGRK